MPSGGSLATAYVQILPATEGIKGNLEKELTPAGEEAGEKAGKKAGGKFSSAMGAVMKATGAALAAAGAAATAVVKGAVENFAEYEQLKGGAELMWGEAYDFIADKAANAFGAVQMSTNDYLESANYYATGLKEALGGGDGAAQAAAELADGIITAQADIVAATGGSAEAISNAFNGVMRGNYTMLDNLGLGITGTKEGMQSVIDSVNEWRETQGEAGNLMIENMADCEQALIDYVKMQGLAGYASAEGTKTIEGSLNSLKAAWQNTLVAMADEEADFDATIDGLVGSAGAFADQIMPRIITAVGGFTTLIGSLAPIIVEQLPILVEQVFPGIASAALSIVSMLVTVLPDLASTLFDVALQLVTQIVTMLPDLLPDLIQGLLDTVTAAVNAVIDAIPDLVHAVIDGILPMLPEILQMGVTFVVELTNGILEAVPDLIAMLPEIVTSVMDTLITMIPMIAECGVQLLTAVAENIDEIVQGICDALPEIIDGLISGIITMIPLIVDAGVQLLGALVQNAPLIIETILLALPEIIGDLVTGILEFVGDLAETGAELISSLIDGMEGQSLGEWFSGVWDDIVAGVSEFATNFWENVKSDLIDPVTEGFENFIEKIEDVFDIDLSLPHINMPHFSITGTFSLSPPSVPKLTVDWYAKAMDEGMILTGPTIFGAAGGSLLGGGEVGDEAIIGTKSLRSMVSEAAADGIGSDDLVEEVRAIRAKLDRIGVYIDRTTLVGAIVDDIDSALGSKSVAVARGY